MRKSQHGRCHLVYRVWWRIYQNSLMCPKYKDRPLRSVLVYMFYLVIYNIRWHHKTEFSYHWHFYERNSLVTGVFPSQRASNADLVLCFFVFNLNKFYAWTSFWTNNRLAGKLRDRHAPVTSFMARYKSFWAELPFKQANWSVSMTVFLRINNQGPLLLTWYNLYPSMDK